MYRKLEVERARRRPSRPAVLSRRMTEFFRPLTEFFRRFDSPSVSASPALNIRRLFWLKLSGSRNACTGLLLLMLDTPPRRPITPRDSDAGALYMPLTEGGGAAGMEWVLGLAALGRTILASFF